MLISFKEIKMNWASWLFFALLVIGAFIFLGLQWTKENLGEKIKNEFGDVIDAEARPVKGFTLRANELGVHTDIDVHNGETFLTNTAGQVYRWVDNNPYLYLEVPSNPNSQGGLLSIAFQGQYCYLSLNVGQQWQLWQVPLNAGNPDVANKSVILSFDGATGAKQGGWIGFGDDNLLYIFLGNNGVPTNMVDWTVPWGKALRIQPIVGGYEVPSGNPENLSVNNITKLIVGWGLSFPWRAVLYQGNFYVGDAVQGDKDNPTKQKVWRQPSGTVAAPGLTMSEYVSPLFDYTSTFNGRVILGAFNDGEVTPDTDQLLFADLSSRDLFMWTVQDGVTKVPDFTLPSNIQTFFRGADGTIFAGTSNGNLYTMDQVL